MRGGLIRMFEQALPDPKGEFAGFLPKTGFVLERRARSYRLVILENPNIAFLRQAVALHPQEDPAQNLVRLCRQQEPERWARLASYTVQRVIERLEVDDQAHKLSSGARRAMARAVIEELVANISIDFDNLIQETISGYLSSAAAVPSDILGYGFSLVEYDEPNTREWEAMSADPRLFCVRFRSDGFTVFRIKDKQQTSQTYTSRAWKSGVTKAMEKWYRQAGQGANKRLWMGIGSGKE